MRKVVKPSTGGCHRSRILPRKHRVAAVFFWALLVLIANGCAAVKMGGTRSLPPTTMPDHIAVSGKIKHLIVAFDPFDVSTTSISGGHFEGLLQVRQPWIWGLSDQQKEAMYGDLLNVARYAFIDQFIRLGIPIQVPEEHSSQLNIPEKRRAKHGRDVPVAIQGTVASIEMNTYGHGLSGMMEGYGSAGNYWEATIAFSNVSVLDGKGNVIWRGDLTKYCKLANSPVKLDWTAFTLISKSLQMATVKGHLFSAKDGITATKADYHIEPINENPVEIAARLAAIDLIGILEKELAYK